MKTSLLSIFAVVLGLSVSAQKFSRNQSNNNDYKVKLEKGRPSDGPNTNTSPYKPNQRAVSKFMKSAPGVVETQIGGTIYDTQTNASVDNRIAVFPDGTIGAVWTMGFSPTSYADRGTGYAYFDGASWSPAPTERIEPVRTGWPSYCALGSSEVIVAHDGSTGLRISKRDVKGTGAWNTTSLPGTLGGAAMTWPRVCGTGNSLHIIVCAAGVYGGLENPLLYYRSTDGGATWDAAKIFPGLDTTSVSARHGKSFNGFGGDEYAWAQPKGDTIAVAVSESMGGAWVLKSFDNGTTWTKITICEIPNLSVAPSPILASTDGSISVALDSHGTAHVVVGRMRVSDDDYVAANNSYYPYTDGLLYWKEGMQQWDTTQLQSLDSLAAHGNLLATMIDYNGNDSIDWPTVGSGELPFGKYGISLTSMGQIVIDKDDNIFVTYSSCREDKVKSNAHPNAQLYRHLYKISWMKGESTWSDPIDLTDDLEHDFDECVFGSLAYSTANGLFNLIYQVDPEPGTAVGADADTPADNYINYLTFPTFVSNQPVVDISKYVMVSPNPATDHADVKVSLVKAGKVELRVFDMMGKLIISEDYGQQTAGYHTYNVNTSSLPSGIYLFNLTIGNARVSNKVIVK